MLALRIDKHFPRCADAEVQPRCLRAVSSLSFLLGQAREGKLLLGADH